MTLDFGGIAARQPNPASERLTGQEADGAGSRPNMRNARAADVGSVK